MEPTPEEVDDAIEQLQEFLDAPESPRVMRLTAKTDQVAAELRDMDEASRRKVIASLVCQGLTEEEAEDYVAGLLKQP